MERPRVQRCVPSSVTVESYVTLCSTCARTACSRMFAQLRPRREPLVAGERQRCSRRSRPRAAASSAGEFTLTRRVGSGAARSLAPARRRRSDADPVAVRLLEQWPCPRFPDRSDRLGRAVRVPEGRRDHQGITARDERRERRGVDQGHVGCQREPGEARQAANRPAAGPSAAPSSLTRSRPAKTGSSRCAARTDT